jgi:hypothetical protein
MVYSSLWRKAKKGAWALILLPNIAFAQFYVTGGIYTLKYEYKNVGSIQTTKEYSRKHGGFIGTRYIESKVYTDDKSRGVYTNIGIGYSYKDFYPSLFYGEHIKGISVRHRWWFIKYGLEIMQMNMLNDVKATTTKSYYDCRVACSYISKLKETTSDTEHIKKEFKDSSINIYFGSYIPLSDMFFIDIGIVINPSSLDNHRKAFIALSSMSG